MNCQIIKNGNNALFCEEYNCRNRASWFIGRPDGPRNLWKNICQECMENMIRTIPEELKGNIQPPEGMVFVSTADLEKLMANQKEPEQENRPEPGTDPGEIPLVCPKCGKECKSQIGLSSHMRSCKGA